MVLSQSVDHAKVCFEHEVLPKILGVPSFKHLEGVKKKVRVNTSSIESKIGSGDHCHLGIVDDDATYFSLSGHHCSRSDHSSPLFITNTTSHHEVIQFREEHTEFTYLFRETTGTENMIKKLISATIEDVYISKLRNRDTSTFTDQHSCILDFLFIS